MARKRAERERAKPLRHPRTSDLWEMRREMDAAGGRGRCIFCEGRLGPKKRLICGSRECTSAYQSMYGMGKRALRAEVRH